MDAIDTAARRATATRARRRTLPLALAVVLVAALSALAAGVAAGGEGAAGNFTATALEPSDGANGVKSQSGRLAKSDPDLLGRTDDTRPST